MDEDDDFPKKPSVLFSRDLESLSLQALDEYISDLKSEITRAEIEITRKKAAQTAAKTFFKPS